MDTRMMRMAICTRAPSLLKATIACLVAVMIAVMVTGCASTMGSRHTKSGGTDVQEVKKDTKLRWSSLHKDYRPASPSVRHAKSGGTRVQEVKRDTKLRWSSLHKDFRPAFPRR